MYVLMQSSGLENPLKVRVGEEYGLNTGIILTNWSREKGKAIRLKQEKVAVIKVREDNENRFW